MVSQDEFYDCHKGQFVPHGTRVYMRGRPTLGRVLRTAFYYLTASTQSSLAQLAGCLPYDTQREPVSYFESVGQPNLHNNRHRISMYHYPVNSLEFKKGYRLGVEKGRKIERKLGLIMLLICMSGWVLFSWLLSVSQKCSWHPLVSRVSKGTSLARTSPGPEPSE